MWLHRKRKEEITPPAIHYSEGSRQAFLRDTQEMIDRLAHQVQRDRNAFDDYLVLGRLYRIRSEAERSLRLHRNLLVKSNLTRDQKMRLFVELGNDILDLRIQDLGVSYFLNAIELQKNYVPALEGLEEAYEEQGRYEQAVEVLERLVRLGKPKKTHLSYVYAALSKKRLAKGQLSKARRSIQYAIKADDNNLYAHLVLAKIYIEGKKFEKALRELKLLLVRWPSHSFLFLRKIEDCHYQMNQYPLFEETLLECLRTSPDNFYLHYSLARHLRKKKRMSDALTALRRALDVNPLYVNAVKDRIEMTGLGDELKEVRAISKTFFEAFKRSRRFICPNCRHRHDDIAWRCDACGQWNVFEIRYELPAP